MTDFIVPTVKVKNSSGGETIINESDYDPKVHELVVLPPPAPPAPPPPPALPEHPLDKLPKDWRTSKQVNRRALAASVSEGRTPENDRQAVEMIEAAIAARVAK